MKTWVLPSMIIGVALASAAVAPAADAAFASVATLLKTMQEEATAFAVLTKQTAVAAQQRNEAQMKTAQMVNNARNAISMNSALIEAARDFSSSTGFPDEIKCGGQSRRSTLVETKAQRDDDLYRLMASFSGARIGHTADADINRINTRLSAYCAQDEARIGACELKPNGMQSWDSNYAGAFNEVSLAPEAEVAGYDYVSMVADVRVPTHIDCASKACDAASVAAIGETAAASMVAFALAGQVADRRLPVLGGQ